MLFGSYFTNQNSQVVVERGKRRLKQGGLGGGSTAEILGPGRARGGGGGIQKFGGWEFSEIGLETVKGFGARQSQDWEGSRGTIKALNTQITEPIKPVCYSRNFGVLLDLVSRKEK